jgi:hypothetical protein
VETQERSKKIKAEQAPASAKYTRGQGPVKLKNLAMSKEARDTLSVHAIAFGVAESVLADYVIRTHLRAHKIVRYSEAALENQATAAGSPVEPLTISETVPFDEPKPFEVGEGSGTPPAPERRKRRA